MNKKIVLILIVSFFAFSLSVYQYIKEFQTDFVSAYTTSKPANGHSWGEMECTSDLCVKSGTGVGVGTDNPTVKFEVGGSIKASGDVCNGTGNCLSALATLTNSCGAAATTYVYAATVYSGAYCAMGVSTPAAPSFPAAGASTTWTCPVANDPTHPISCTATHAAAPVNGACGPAHTTYTALDTAYAGAYCSSGTASGSPAFPAIGASSNWSCMGTGGGSNPSCLATRSSPVDLVNNIHTNVNCTAAGGEVVGSGQSGDQCRFNAAVCPIGWERFRLWSTTTVATRTEQHSLTGPSRSCSGACMDTTVKDNIVVTSGSHAWADASAEVGTAYGWGVLTQDMDWGCNPSFSYGCGWAPIMTITANITQIGCY
jgi:hypothetical protein